jgi:hypothetical protein
MTSRASGVSAGVADPVSVGAAVADRGMFTIDHPQYKILAEAVTQRLAQVASERAQARAAARAVPVAVSLQTQDLGEVTLMYPEFTFVNYGMYRPGHSRWVQTRRLANEWIMTQAARYTDSVCHLGGSVASYLLDPVMKGQLLVDQTDPVSLHEFHAQTVEAYRYYGDFASVGEDLGRVLPRSKYEAYLNGEVLSVDATTAPLAKSDVLLVDLSLRVMPPSQVAAMMIETEASVCFGFFPYCPQMIVSDNGSFEGTGVSFVRKADGVALQYPEGPAGTGFMEYVNWEPWLVSHTFSAGSLLGRRYFQVELLKNRGQFMFFRMVALDSVPQRCDLTHALDVDQAEPVYLVSVPELVTYNADPSLPTSWVVKPFTVSQRVVDRVYNDAMQLSREQFTSRAVRKKISEVNDRIVVNGTRVQVNTSLGLSVLTRLTLAITSRCFVDRYEAGRLMEEVMQAAKVLMRPSVAHAGMRASLLMYYMSSLVSRPTAFVDKALSTVAEWVETVFGRARVVQPGVFGIPLGYVRVGETCTALVHGLKYAGPEVLVSQARPVAGMPSLFLAEAMTRAALSRAVHPLTSGWALLVKPGASAARAPSEGVNPLEPDVGLGAFHASEQSLFEDGRHDSLADKLVDAVRRTGEVTAAGLHTHDVSAMTVEGDRAQQRHDHVEVVADPVGVFNEFYARVNPGVAPQELEQDTASIALDPQDRYVTAQRLVLPSDMSSVPNPRRVYKSRIQALNVSKRQGTLQELFSASASRNLSAPQVSLPQDEDRAVVDVWECFLAEACVPDAREKLAAYQADPVALTDEGLRGWAAQADEKKIQRVVTALEASGEALLSMDVGEYMMMLKSDVKPDLTTKPIFQRIEPQVIVYHKTELNALYSSVFRVLVRRFLSLLKPNYKVVLMKDMMEVERAVQNLHPFGRVLKYLENDFSKYDKSQGRFVYMLEAFVFDQLGMNTEFLEHWLGGHRFSRVRSVALGMSLHLDYQRKSGDATTSFGNVLVNVLSVTYAYRGTGVVWAIFMGDDSLVCATEVQGDRNAVRVLAEVFNLGSKTFVTEQPYFASNFLMIDDANAVVRFLPDPVKRVARWSMNVSAEDPLWQERWESARDACKAYGDEFNVSALPSLVSVRYDVKPEDVALAVRAVATVVTDFKAFRSMWDVMPTTITY